MDYTLGIADIPELGTRSRNNCFDETTKLALNEFLKIIQLGSRNIVKNIVPTNPINIDITNAVSIEFFIMKTDVKVIAHCFLLGYVYIIHWFSSSYTPANST